MSHTQSRQKLFFDKAKDPFVAPQTSSHVRDIHTGCCYRKTYNALIKKSDVGRLLPCIMAMDKTYIDMAGRLQMEPITISHGLLNHTMRRNSNALKQYNVLCAKLGRSLLRQSDRDIPRTNFPEGFSSGSNLMGHEMPGYLLVTLFALHTTYFLGIFEVGKKVATEGDDQRFCYEHYIQDWIGVVASF